MFGVGPSCWVGPSLSWSDRWPFLLTVGVANSGRGWPFCLGLVVGQFCVVIINNYKQNPYFSYVGGGKKRRQALALRVGVGPLGWGWQFLFGFGVGPLGWGWPFLFGFGVGPSLSGLKLALRGGVGTPFLGLGLAVPSFGQGWPFSE